MPQVVPLPKTVPAVLSQRLLSPKRETPLPRGATVEEVLQADPLGAVLAELSVVSALRAAVPANDTVREIQWRLVVPGEEFRPHMPECFGPSCEAALSTSRRKRAFWASREACREVLGGDERRELVALVEVVVGYEMAWEAGGGVAGADGRPLANPFTFLRYVWETGYGLEDVDAKAVRLVAPRW